MGDSVVASARSLFDLIRSEAPASEALHTLSTPVVDALKTHHIFDLNVPRALGGLEADARTYLEAIETIAEADGSAGWCVMIAAECNGMLAAMLPEETATKLFAQGPLATGGSAVPASVRPSIDIRGESAHVTGRWRFASGSPHCDYLFTGGPLTRDGEPVLTASGRQANATVFLPRELVVLHDNWRPLGLRGTGSNDFEAVDVVAPLELVVQSRPLRPVTALTRFPNGAFLAMGKAAVATGIGRGAINELLAIVGDKQPWLSGTPLRDEVRIQIDVAEAEATLRSARAFLFEAVQEAWDTLLTGGDVTVRQAALVRLASVHAVKASCDVIELAYHAAGTSSLPETSPLQRALRDAHAVRQHANVAARFREDAGRVLVGLPPKEPMF